MYKDLFERALHIESPWYVKNIDFNEIERQLIVYVDFKKGSKFSYEKPDEEIKGEFSVYDTTQKS
jgi:transposase